ncbi:hypothetical protein [Macrococcoides caseolyticum]|uniref:DUF91 domain-containing protein n=1 Tax=Macrococcus caseolyticus (strain JCSC5402) TaxID=458233 RepID=B9E7M0_MACCJ|nr:hypothetical protein [Macrococcus caseolyticus]BAH18188.1 hypothetical protein MCCL_1481 [Macrococcus caseolyticus JCSC5402]
MAGYIFSVGKEINILDAMKKGVFSTNFKHVRSYWTAQQEGTIADYMTMKENDNIYFFQNRKIYGIGKLKKIKLDVKLLNFPDADLPEIYNYQELGNEVIYNSDMEFENYRVLISFEGSPYIFSKGVDMDEILSSNPSNFKILRAFWKLSFIKVDDNENSALFDIILKKNEMNYLDNKNIIEVSNYYHERINNLVNKNYLLDSKRFLEKCLEGKRIKHEMALEMGILDAIQKNKTLFGKWDYLSHQVIASPFKPIDYMDKMDVFGYRFIDGYNTISKYLMIEIKSGVASIEVLNQAMKYVDWIENEYSHDYEMIEAYIVALDFTEEVLQTKNKFARRMYTIGRNPVETKEWVNLKLIQYEFLDNELKFKELE